MTVIWDSPAGRQAVEERYRAFLGHWPGPSQQLRIPTREGETFAVACGPPQAPPVVLLHGAGANTVMWMGDAAAWSSARRVYAVDVIGEPGLSAPSRPPLTSGAYADWLDDVLDGLGVSRAAMVGVSLGGWLALDHAIRRPARVERLAVMAPGGVGRQKYRAVAASLVLMPLGDRGRRLALRLLRRLLPQADVALLPDSGHLVLGQTQRIGEFLTAGSRDSDT
jgi:pimeloyl-ACP methyl ester carboxylesterase